jgi:hypothetical protein
MLLYDDASITKKRHQILNVGNNSIEEILPPIPKEELNYEDDEKNIKGHQIVSVNNYKEIGVIKDTPLSDKLPPYIDVDTGKEHKVIATPIINSGYIIGKDGLTISGIIEGTPQIENVYNGVDSEVSYESRENDNNSRSLSQVYIDRTDNLDDHDINLDNVIF